MCIIIANTTGNPTTLPHATPVTTTPIRISFLGPMP